jgi:hypothetical protein
MISAIYAVLSRLDRCSDRPRVEMVEMPRITGVFDRLDLRPGDRGAETDENDHIGAFDRLDPRGTESAAGTGDWRARAALLPVLIHRCCSSLAAS